MKNFFFFLLFLVSTGVFAQNNDEWAGWNKNYPKVDGTKVLKAEKSYAEYVEKHPEIEQYYVRQGSYRVVAEYMGKTRPLDTNVHASMYRAYTLTRRRDAKELDEIYKTEVLFKIGNEELWMPIQVNVLKGLKEEVAKGDKITLYCFFLNEHTVKNVLYDTFMIGEFVK